MIDRDFRLSKDVMPVRYALRIDADMDNWRFRGIERIDLTVRRATSEIILHSVDLEIHSALVRTGGTAHEATVSFSVDAEAVILRFGKAIAAGPAELEIDFSGTILERLRGFYRSRKDGACYAATQFEAADARRAFPCFDEPEFKARFALTLVIPPAMIAVSNGAQEAVRTLPDGRTEIRFAETPPISSYLVAYCIGPFEATAAATTPSGVPVRAIVPQGLADKGIYARGVRVSCLRWLEGYTDMW